MSKPMLNSHVKKKFDYFRRDPAEIKRRATASRSGFDNIFVQGAPTFTCKDGENVIRILPPTWPNHKHWGYDIMVHSNIGAGAKKGTYLCLGMKKKRCPICEVAEDASAAGEKDLYYQTNARERRVVWMIDRNKEAEGAKLWSMSESQDREICAQAQPRKGNVLYIDHPDEGFDITMQRSGKGLNTKYFGTNVDRETTPVSDDPRTQEKILDYIQENPVPSMLKFQTEEYLEKVIAGTAEEKDEDLDEDPAPTPGKKRPRAPDPTEDDGTFPEEGEDDAPDEDAEQPDDASEDDGDEDDGADDEDGEPEDEPAPKKPTAQARTKISTRARPRHDTEEDAQEEEFKPRKATTATTQGRIRPRR